MEFAGFGMYLDGRTRGVPEILRSPDDAHRGMRRYFDRRSGVGWFADEYMFRDGTAASCGRSILAMAHGVHHLSFRRDSRAESIRATRCSRKSARRLSVPAEPGPFWPGYYSVGVEDPDGTRLEIELHPTEGWKAVANSADAIAKGQIAVVKSPSNASRRRVDEAGSRRPRVHRRRLVDLSAQRRGHADDGYGRRQGDADAAAVVEHRLRGDHLCDVSIMMVAMMIRLPRR